MVGLVLDCGDCAWVGEISVEVWMLVWWPGLWRVEVVLVVFLYPRWACSLGLARSVLRSVVSLVRGNGSGCSMAEGGSLEVLIGREGEDTGWRRAG